MGLAIIKDCLKPELQEAFRKMVVETLGNLKAVTKDQDEPRVSLN